MTATIRYASSPGHQRSREPGDAPGYDDQSGYDETLSDTPAYAVAAPTMTVGSADDAAEISADAAAARALGRLPSTRDAAAGDGGCNTQAPVGGGAIGAQGGALDARTAGLIERHRGRGRPLAPPVRRRMESAFGHNFGAVNIHDGTDAAAANKAVSARAFTVGSDIFFGRGQYNPASDTGEQVLAHELAHVAQGSAAMHRWPWSKKSPEKKAAEQQKKQEAQQRKAEQKAQKKQYTDEKSRLAGERATGTAKRAELSEEVTSDPKKMAELNKRFAKALEREKELYASLVDEKGEDAARDIAYRTVWLDTDDADLRALRPPRETAAERLASQVRQMRTAAAVADMSSDDGRQESAGDSEAADDADSQAEPAEPEPKKKKKGLFSRGISLMNKAGALAGAGGKRLAGASAFITKSSASAGAYLGKVNKLTGGALPMGTLTSITKGVGTAGEGVGLGAQVATGASEVLGQTGGESDKATGGEAEAGQTASGAKTSEATSAAEKSTADSEKDSAADQETETATDGKDSAEKADEEPAEGQEGAFHEIEKDIDTGIQTSKSIVADLLATVEALMKFAQAVKKAHADRSVENVAAATAASALALNQMAANANKSAALAKKLDPSVSAAVGTVTPGFDMAGKITEMIAKASDLGTAASRVDQTDKALFDARAKKSGAASGPDVMVYPLLRVLQSHTKNLEQAIWDASLSVGTFTTTLAKSTWESDKEYGFSDLAHDGQTIVNKLHNAGHFVASQVLVSITKKAQQDSIGALEGAAENQLEKDPAMAVDGIIMSAASGDKIATEFLANYQLDGEAITKEQLAGITKNPKMFTKIRTVVLADMREDADPQLVYTTWRKKASSILGSIKSNTVGVLHGGSGTEKAPDDGDRGISWRLTMMLSDAKVAERAKKRQAQTGDHAADSTEGVLDDQVECVCGQAQLPVSASKKAQQTFAEALANEPDEALEKAAKNSKNSPEWQAFFRDILGDRALEAAKAQQAA